MTKILSRFKRFDNFINTLRNVLTILRKTLEKIAVRGRSPLHIKALNF